MVVLSLIVNSTILDHFIVAHPVWRSNTTQVFPRYSEDARKSISIVLLLCVVGTISRKVYFHKPCNIAPGIGHLSGRNSQKSI